MLVLGIETSCDETALALVADGQRVIGTHVVSSLKFHQPYGGIIPEIASRVHLELMTCGLETLLQSCRITPTQIDRIAVTYGPGLAGSLLVGIAAAKALGLAWAKPVVGVNHLQAHLYASIMATSSWPLDASMIGVVISGGHTAIVQMDGIGHYTVLGQTRDDAVGEAFDKVAKLLGLGFPGGPEIERVASSGNPTAFQFRPPRMKSGSLYDFSLSGLKTAVLYKLLEIKQKRPSSGYRGGRRRQNRWDLPRGSPSLGSLPRETVADMAASFQSSIVEEIIEKTFAACRAKKVKRLLVGGGVVANSLLRRRLLEVSHDLKMDCAIPGIGLCTDNGAMVGGLGVHLKALSPEALTATPDLRVEMN